MKYQPSDQQLQKHIDHYWIVNEPLSIFGESPPVYAFPGMRPDLILILDGHFNFTYCGQTDSVYKSRMCSFIHQEVVFDHHPLHAFIIVQFKARALSSLLPFVSLKARELMNQPICEASAVFGPALEQLVDSLRGQAVAEQIARLDTFFLQHYQREREGFITEMAQEFKHSFSLGEIRKHTKYSYATLDRYFKKDTGLSPKNYQTLRRYKTAVEEIYQTRNQDWSHYVEQYNYFDQSHFIKEIKRFTGFTPTQLLQLPALLDFRI
ncbi:MAG: AraC family transcriptional regulator [Bacteroidota bacterium]